MSRQYAPLVDLVKAIAAQLIVLHHLAWFGPMSDVAASAGSLGASMQSWLADYGRYAVAAFLASGGFLAGRSLAPGAFPVGETPWRLIGQRYLRLVGPFAVSLGLALIAAMLTHKLMVHDSIGPVPTVGQLLAHLFLLHGLLNVESITAGAWYVAIDFQLYALLVLLVWFSQRWLRHPAIADFSGVVPVAAFALASLMVFNRHDAWDATAFYFFGAYAFGVGAAWSRRMHKPWLGLGLVAAIGMAALLVDYRGRIAVALAVALFLGVGQLLWQRAGNQIIATLSRHSYSLFLVHFPVCLLVNGLVTWLEPDDPLENTLGLLLAWALSNLVSTYFYRHVEKPLVQGWSSRPLGSARID